MRLPYKPPCPSVGRLVHATIEGLVVIHFSGCGYYVRTFIPCLNHLPPAPPPHHKPPPSLNPPPSSLLPIYPPPPPLLPGELLASVVAKLTTTSPLEIFIIKHAFKVRVNFHHFIRNVV